MSLDWSKYPNFKKEEFDCLQTGKNDMQPEFMDRLQALRTEWGKPLRITSGFRDVSHPRETSKAAPGQHTKGLAADIACGADVAYALAALAFKHGFRGIGVSQKVGGARFLHIDLRSDVPVLYSY